MKKYLIICLITLSFSVCTHAQTNPGGFVPGYNVIFEDNFSQDPIGDLPARWNTTSGGEVVELDGFDGKWFKIMADMSVNPELKKKLPEDCTIEFDLVIKEQSCRAFFGIMPFSGVTSGNVYYKKIYAHLQNITGYPDLTFGKDIESKAGSFEMSGYIDRVLHVSIAINKTRFRVFLDETKAVDLPKIVVPEYRNNFFIAGGGFIPAPAEGIYISNVRIAAGEADARRLLIKQLFEQGSVVTNDISFNPQTNEMTQESYPLLDTLGQAMIEDPNLSIEINGMEQMPEATGSVPGNNALEEIAKQKVEKIKNYLTNKFNLGVDRVVTTTTNKIKTKVDQLKNGKTGQKVKGFLTEIIKL